MITVNKQASAPDKNFDAFISYSHAADGQLSVMVQRGLERFANPWYHRRALRIFRDETGLAVTEHLWSTIRSALRASSHFILLASPEAAESKWVAREITDRLEAKGVVHIVLTSGTIVWDDRTNDFDWEVTDALPSVLRGHFEDEPLYLDLTWAKAETDLSLDHPKFRDVIASLAAPIHGIDKAELSSEAVLQHRKTIRTAWAAAITLAALLIATAFFAGFAVIARNEAEAQRDLAERRLQDALDVANHIVFTVDQKLKGVAGAGPVRGELLASGTELLGNLTSDTESTSYDTIEASKFANHVMRGDLAMSHGDLDEADSWYSQALTLADRMPEDSTPGGTRSTLRAIGLMKLGIVAEDRGNLDVAQKRYEEELALRIAAVEYHRTSPDHAAGLIASYSNLGDIQRTRGDLDAAFAFYEKAVKISQNEMVRDPENAQLRLDHVLLLHRRGRISLQKGIPEAALAQIEESRLIIEKLRTESPSNAEYQIALLQNHLVQGDAELMVNDLGTAWKSYDSARLLADQLAQAGPESTEYVEMQSLTYEKLGDVARLAGRLDVARPQMERSLKATEKLVELDPSNVTFLKGVFSGRLKLGQISLALGDAEAATIQLEAARSQAEMLVALDPTNLELKRYIVLAELASSEIALDAGKAEEARHHCGEALRISTDLAERTSDHDIRRDVTSATQCLGDIAMRQNDLPAARLHYQRTLEVVLHLAEKRPDVVMLRRDVGIAQQRLSNVEFEAGNLSEARTLLEKARSVATELLIQNGNVVYFHGDLGQYELNLSRVAEAENEFGKAADHVLESLVAYVTANSLSPQNRDIGRKVEYCVKSFKALLLKLPRSTATDKVWALSRRAQGLIPNRPDAAYFLIYQNTVVAYEGLEDPQLALKLSDPLLRSRDNEIVRCLRAELGVAAALRDIEMFDLIEACRSTASISPESQVRAEVLELIAARALGRSEAQEQATVSLRRALARPSTLPVGQFSALKRSLHGRLDDNDPIFDLLTILEMASAGERAVQLEPILKRLR